MKTIKSLFPTAILAFGLLFVGHVLLARKPGEKEIGSRVSPVLAPRDPMLTIERLAREPAEKEIG